MKKRETGRFLPIRQIRLLPGTVFEKRQKEMMEFLLSADDDQMLYNFRTVAGLNTKSAVPMTGWDEPAGNLRGHTTGHYLSGLALAWACSQDQRFADKIQYMVSELTACQEALENVPGCQRGFLSAYTEEQFDLLEVFTEYPKIWAPYYTLDKIMSGLYDCYMMADCGQALKLMEKMGDWVFRRLSKLPQETLDHMWSMYIAGEFGGMQGTMLHLYTLTDRKEYLDTALLFCNKKLLVPMIRNQDILDGMHANQHIPQAMGAAELYRATGNQSYLDAAFHFWDIVTGHHAYCFGGVGEGEMFRRADSNSQYLNEKTAESCASYNMLRLTGLLFPERPQSTMFDYYENTLLNHIMASCSHDTSCGTIYFFPSHPGGQKEYTTDENTCCHGTGMESRFRYLEHLFYDDGEYFRVNLFVDCRVQLSPEVFGSSNPSEETAAALELGTLQNHEPQMFSVNLRFKGNWKHKVAVRLPGWSGGNYTAERKCSSASHEAIAYEKADGYLFFDRIPKNREEWVLHFPMEYSLKTDASDPDLMHLQYGPWILAAEEANTGFLEAPELSELLPGEETDSHGEKQWYLKDGKRKWMPLCELDQERYHIYFRRLVRG